MPKINGEEFKLRDHAPKPTREEQEICEAFCNGKWSAKTADQFKAQVQSIVARYGEVIVEKGRLCPSTSVSYPMPTLAEFDERIAAVKAALGPDAERLVAQMERYRQDLVEVLELERRLDEWVLYFKATGVIRAKSAPTVKFMELRKIELPDAPPALEESA